MSNSNEDDKISFRIVTIIATIIFIITIIVVGIKIFNEAKLKDKFETYETQEVEISPMTYSCVQGNKYTYVNYDLYDGVNIPKVVDVIINGIIVDYNYSKHKVSVYSEDEKEVTYLVEFDEAYWFIYEDKLSGLTYALQYFGQLD